MFDAMHLRPHVQYIHTSDEVIGVETIHNGVRKDVLAQTVLVFMIRSVFGGWCQVVGHHFVGSKFAKDDLTSLLMEYLAAMHSTGLRCKALICDQEPSHMAMFKSLGVSRKTPYIESQISNDRIHVILDPPHLLKSTRNNLLQHDFLVSVTAYNRCVLLFTSVRFHAFMFFF